MIARMSSDTAVRNISILRIAIGVTSWLAPRLAGRLFGLDPVRNPQSAYLARLFGVRDIALGVGALQSSGAARRQWLQLGMACDGADVLAGIAGKRDGSLPGLTSAMVTTTAAVAAAQSAAAIKALDQEASTAS
jgi:hypothetical protein